MSVYKGIWLDHQEAYIVTVRDKKSTLSKLQSGAESKYHLTGGSRSKTPYGPQDVVPEHKLEERRKHQLQSYYQKITEKCKNAERLYLFGPNGAKKELMKLIDEDKELSSLDVETETSDKMTRNQIIAKVKEHFGK